MTARALFRWPAGPASSGDGATIEQYHADAGDGPSELATAPGRYHRLVVDGVILMTDTDDMFRPTAPAIAATAAGGVRSAILTGLGLGGAARAIAANVDRVDVIELDARVIELVAPTLDHTKVVIHHADAHRFTPPPSARWDLAYHDIGADPSALLDRFAPFAAAQLAWGRP